jgi:hypothetical protein
LNDVDDLKRDQLNMGKDVAQAAHLLTRDEARRIDLMNAR